MDWFEQLTGFKETDYVQTRSQLRVEGKSLISLVNARRYGIGTFTTPSLAHLRAKHEEVAARLAAKQTTTETVYGDIRLLHAHPEFRGATIQVASQFNMLEMTSPAITPEHGVTRYQYDRTQGPACAIAAGAATIFRNYFVNVGSHVGQTAEHQLNGLADFELALVAAIPKQSNPFLDMRNGYALCTAAGLAAIAELLCSLTEFRRNELTGMLRYGWHDSVEVTFGRAAAEGQNDEYVAEQTVSQVFCSALPVAYSKHPAADWEPFARLILSAAYEASFRCAAIRASLGESNILLLTRLGAGAFGNDESWVDQAIDEALCMFQHCGLRVIFVRYA